MQAVIAIAVAAVRSFANLDVVLAVGRSEDRCGRVLLQQRRVVSRDEFESLRVENGDVRIEHRHAEPHAFDLDADPLSLLGVDHEIIDVFRIDDAVDRHIQGNWLRRGEFGVRFLLFNFGERTDIERAVFGDAARRTDVADVLAKPAIWGDFDRGLDRPRARLELSDGKAGRKEHDLLGVSQLSTVEGEHALLTALQASGEDHTERRRRGLHAEDSVREQANRQCRKENRSHPTPHGKSPVRNSTRGCRGTTERMKAEG